jgi:hypothetical protein
VLRAPQLLARVANQRVAPVGSEGVQGPPEWAVMLEMPRQRAPVLQPRAAATLPRMLLLVATPSAALLVSACALSAPRVSVATIVSVASVSSTTAKALCV